MSGPQHRIGLIGSDISGSLSPLLHETEARELGMRDHSYETIDIAARHLAADAAAVLVRTAVAEGFTGFNVTHPCKQTVMSGLDEVDEHAATIGAVNTVTVRDGRLTGHNTDESGFRAALDMVLSGDELGRVVMFGAGGAGSAVAHALINAGVRGLTIVDVDSARAASLAGRINASGTVAVGATMGEAAGHVRHADGVVNATPIGMDGHPGTPFDVTLLTGRQWVADIVYRPAVTELLSAARDLGCRTVDGAQMLVEQAADSFALLTGVQPDRSRMRRHLAQTLAGRTRAQPAGMHS
ncbi:shikimate dehydrogenase [Gordonia desulfuricans]|uniref:Shikimate dehydrogenase (NADP(+)) n=1 Tax=Gordonia desulfuricans TaxID=89051 RepID=A0A7K3LPX1_9ACTN|nr:shikimate dehydrogenase [Gordonia desulfuricans]NDK90285.1 shikimate dehydrogenase [Gordonia desulfuricans]